jgi:monofunctional biosynthetic peptidoglycan transglycosylase
MAETEDDKPKDAVEAEAVAPEVEPVIEPAVLAAEPPPSFNSRSPEKVEHIELGQSATARLNENAPKAKKVRVRKPWSFGRFVWGAIKLGFLVGIVIPLVMVLIYRFVPPPGTILMAQGAFQGRGLDYRWRPLRKISPALVSAAVASEDGKFCTHHGFDFEAIDKAMANNARGRRVKGGSTISQQTAKNVFLWPQRDWVRKGAETWFTVLIETIWGKKRIMEVYLNVAEMGPGVYGAEAAAQRYFHTDAAHLTTAQAARLIAVLPSPIRYKVAAPGKYVAKRTGRVAAAAGMVRREGFAECVLR